MVQVAAMKPNVDSQTSRNELRSVLHASEPLGVCHVSGNSRQDRGKRGKRERN